MKAKELKSAVVAGKLDVWTVGQINKTPLTNRQNESLYVEIVGIGRVDTTKIIDATNFEPYKFSMTLHFCGASCPLDGQMVWEAFLKTADAANRRVEIAEGVRNPNTL